MRKKSIDKLRYRVYNEYIITPQGNKEVIKMLLNLKDLLIKGKTTYKDLADRLGVSEKSIYSKVNEKTDFTLAEIKKIHKFVFPQYDFQYLFASDKSA